MMLKLNHFSIFHQCRRNITANAKIKAYHFNLEAERTRRPPKYYMPPGYFVHVSPGSRVLELTEAKKGNFLTARLMTSLAAKFNFYVDNVIAENIFVHSFARYGLFSSGFKKEEYKLDPAKCVVAAQRLANAVANFPKNILASYSGRLNGTAYAVFARGKYRLTSPSTLFCMDDMFHGFLPVGGAAHYFVNNCHNGLAMARYLAVSKRELLAEELYRLNLSSHVVMNDPHDSIEHGLSMSLPDEFNTKAFQTLHVSRNALDVILEMMHVGSCDVDVFKAPCWERLMVVPPAWTLEEEEYQEGLIEIDDIVKKCFSVDDPNETIRLLRSENAARSDKEKFEFVEPTIALMQQLPPQLLQSWYDVTKQAVTETLPESYQTELKHIAICRQFVE